MGKVVSVTIITKPEQLDKLDTGPYHILLGPNLRISKNKKIKCNKCHHTLILVQSSYNFLGR